MRQAQTRTLFAHWRTLVRNGAPPDRNDLDPAAIAPALRDVFILGRDAHGIWRYRVAGTRLSAYADRDLRDEPFADWWRPEDRADMRRLLRSTAEERSPIVGGVRGEAAGGGPHDLELILLPLRHGGRDGLRLLGGFFPSSETAKLYDVRLRDLAIASIRSLDEAAADGDRFGRPRADIERLVERRRSFRVIEGGKSAAAQPF
jgi:hypothetical protein